MLKSRGVWKNQACETSSSGFHLFLKKILDFQMNKGAVDIKKKVGWKRNQIHLQPKERAK